MLYTLKRWIAVHSLAMTNIVSISKLIPQYTTSFPHELIQNLISYRILLPPLDFYLKSAEILKHRETYHSLLPNESSTHRCSYLSYEQTKKQSKVEIMTRLTFKQILCYRQQGRPLSQGLQNIRYQYQ